MSLSFTRPQCDRINAVVLDWAGTTIDFGSRAPVTTLVRLFETHGISLSLEQARGPMGRAKRDHIKAILELPEIVDAWQQLHGKRPGEEEIDLLFAGFGPIQEEVISQFSALIPGCVETIEWCRSREIKIGSSTGYSSEQMELVVPLAAAQGYEADAVVCASDVSPGRPAPWMIFENAQRLNAYPMHSIVKVDDTLVGIEAGLNAGCWTIGITAAGNMVGLSEDELESLPSDKRREIVDKAADKFNCAGAHLVIESIADLPHAIDEIEAYLQAREPVLA